MLTVYIRKAGCFRGFLPFGLPIGFDALEQLAVNIGDVCHGLYRLVFERRQGERVRIAAGFPRAHFGSETARDFLTLYIEQSPPKPEYRVARLLGLEKLPPANHSPTGVCGDFADDAAIGPNHRLGLRPMGRC